MKVKPKEIFVNLPIVLLFDDAYSIPEFASNINQIIHGKVKVKYETLGILSEQYIGIFYLQRNDEFTELRQEFTTLIEQEEIRHHQVENYSKKMLDLDCGEIYESKKDTKAESHEDEGISGYGAMDPSEEGQK